MSKTDAMVLNNKCFHFKNVLVCWISYGTNNDSSMVLSKEIKYRGPLLSIIIFGVTEKK